MLAPTGTEASDDDSDLTQPPQKSVFQILHEWETSSDSSESNDMFCNLLSPFCGDFVHNSLTEVLVGLTDTSVEEHSDCSEILCDIPTE